ncbi:MAG: hypothetical protein V4651_10880 [Bacteroidota bacterium]
MNLTQEQKAMLKKAHEKGTIPPLYVALTYLSGGGLRTASDAGLASDGSVMVCGSGPSDQTGGGAYPVLLKVNPDYTSGKVYNSFVNDPNKQLSGNATDLCIFNSLLTFISFNVTQANGNQIPYIGYELDGLVGSLPLPLGTGNIGGIANAVYASLSGGLIATGSVYNTAGNSTPVIWKVVVDINNPLNSGIVTVKLSLPSGFLYGTVECASFTDGTTYVGGVAYNNPVATVPVVWTINDDNNPPFLLVNNEYPYGDVLYSSPNGQYLCGRIYIPGFPQQAKAAIWKFDKTEYKYSDSVSKVGSVATMVNDKGTVIFEVTNDSGSPYIFGPDSWGSVMGMFTYLDILGTNLPPNLNGFSVTNISVDGKVVVGNGTSVENPTNEAWIVLNPFLPSPTKTHKEK